MDQVRAEALATQLIGQLVGGWRVLELVNHGKSAAVFKADRSGVAAALKIFDAELIERFGSEIQIARIEREMKLKGAQHPNLIEIYDGGFDYRHGLYFVVMEYVVEPNLAQQLEQVGPSSISSLVQQLASAAKFLEDRGLVHRDIKPSNMTWDTVTGRLRLLDLGVLGPIGNIGCLTDLEGLQFIGTLQYSSPEYLLREEEDTLSSWRAITFYQIGAVMHDLIMRKPIFSEFVNPFGRLVNAVQHEQPLIKSSQVDSAVVELARACLVKSPVTRLLLVTWEKFDKLTRAPSASVKERVTNRLMLSAAEREKSNVPTSEDLRRELLAELSATLRRYVNTIAKDNSVFPPVTVVRDRDQTSLLLSLRASARHRLPAGLKIKVQWKVLEPAEKVVELSGRIAEDADDSLSSIFFAGVLDYQTLYTAFEDLIYAFLDQVQSDLV